MAEKDNGEEGLLYSSTFAPLLRQKAVAIWSLHQAVVAGILIAVFMLRTAVAHAPVLSWATLVLVAILVVDLVTVRGLSMWQVAGLRLGLLLRQATGATKATFSPITSGATVAFADIPGEEGETVNTYRVVNTGEMDGACFLWDSVHNQATAPLLMEAQSDQLAKADIRNTRADEFAAALHSLADQPDVVRVTLQARALRRPVEKSPGLSAAEGNAAAADIEYLEDGPLAHTIRHDYILGITIDPSARSTSKVNFSKPRASLEDVSRLLAKRVSELCSMLAGTGVRPDGITWMNAAQVRGQMKVLTDPDAYQLLDPQGNLPDDVPVQTSWREMADHVAVGPSYARSFWISQWPVGLPVFSDWLTELTRSPDSQQILTLVFHHRTEHQAKASFDRKNQEAGSMRWLNRKLDRPDDDKIESEEQTIARLKRESSENGGDIQFQGFATILADDLSALDEADQGIQRLFKKKGMYLDRQRDQQLTRWVGALPLGLEGRK
ncbi:SCO6880 family protein [Bifidobacterium xylocopae]|uniref:PrgI family protein n=1 Tax=Bifidobacterium xylocopae TaxID=2493119 RepID=A0A366KCJ0_9BIFI|nr:SCO6880 family protein [Bifidobacterium xylocopae]RBP98833.1 hypothetical protein CRD59_07005 [Bifidobacterium xylocopae]